MNKEKASEQMRIMVVEDNLDDAELLDFKLQQVKHDSYLTFADSLSKALSVLELTPFDLVLLDLGLPDSDGIETFTKMAAKHPFLPIIVLTGRDDETLALQLLRLGALDFLVKDQVTTPLLTRSIKYAIASKQAQETSRWLASIVESSTDAIIGKSTANVILSWNSGAELIYGYKAEEAIGKPIEFILAPDRLHEGKEILDRVLAGEMVPPYLTQRQRKDGSIITASVSASPVRNLNDEIIGASSISRDVTDLIHAQRVAMEQSERLINALEIASVGSWDWHIQFDIVKWDKRTLQMFGITDDAQAPKCLDDFLQLVHIEDRVRVKQSLDESLAAGAFNEVEYRITKPNGEIRHIAARGRVLKDHNDQIDRMLGTCIDITERKIAQQNDQRLTLLEAREEFMATLTHDLKNPLLGASRLLDLITDSESNLSEEQRQEILWHIKDGHKQLLLMISNLTEVYCLERDANALYFEMINLSETLHSALNEIKPLICTKKLELKSSIHDHLPVRADRLSMQRVLQNLLGNALKFTGEKGTIKVTAVLQDGKIHLEVEDNGKGISLHDQAHLFQRFGRGKSERHSTPGTGLGLYYCKKVIEAHDGKITYIHKDGKGAHFRAELPAAL